MEIHQQMEWRHTSKWNGHTQTMEGDTPNKMEIHQEMELTYINKQDGETSTMGWRYTNK